MNKNKHISNTQNYSLDLYLVAQKYPISLCVGVQNYMPSLCFGGNTTDFYIGQNLKKTPPPYSYAVPLQNIFKLICLHSPILLGFRTVLSSFIKSVIYPFHKLNTFAPAQPVTTINL